MFDGFEEFDVDVSDTTIHGRRGGRGPAVLLLHGIPETHVMWHHVAPALAADYSVVAADLTGYGDSGKPPSDDDHARYSMRAIANHQVELMRALGYGEFAVIGHDRGARCAYRMALDHAAVVNKLGVLDIVPTGEAFRSAGKDFSLGFCVWAFLAADHPVPERLIAAAPDVLVNYMLDAWSTTGDAFPNHVREEYVEKFSNPDTIHAVCEQYRAAATLDFEHDQLDYQSRRITCLVLCLWSKYGPVETWYRPLEVWSEWADTVHGRAIETGHFLAEEAPEVVTREVLDFLGSR